MLSVKNFPFVFLSFFFLLNSAEAVERLRLHHFLSPTSTTHAEMLAPWAAAIEKESQGQLKIDIYPAMQLGGSPTQLYDQARRGTADIVWTLPGYTSGRFPLMEAFELPFMAGTAEATSQAAYEYYTKYAQEEFKGVHILAVHVHAPGVFHMKNKPIRRLEDMRGLKIRGPTRIITDMLSNYGATPVAMPVPALPDALAKGVVDGALIPYEVARPLRVHELTNSHTGVRGARGLYTAVFILAMNKNRYDALSPDLRAAIDKHSYLPLVRSAGRTWDKADLPVIQAAQERGNAFYYIEGTELAKWQELSTVVTRKWIKEMTAKGHDGALLVQEAQRLIEKYERSK